MAQMVANVLIAVLEQIGVQTYLRPHRRFGPSVRLVAKKSGADANTSTLSPTERIKLLRAARIDASSSMTKTIGGIFSACRMLIWFISLIVSMSIFS